MMSTKPTYCGWRNACVGPGRGQAVRALRVVEHPPRGREQPEAAADEDKAQHVKRSEVRIGAPAEHHLQQVPRIVARPVHAGKA